jgi:hypothetical protein
MTAFEGVHGDTSKTTRYKGYDIQAQFERAWNSLH